MFPQPINVYTALEKLRSPSGQNYTVWAYLPETGKTDFVINLGNYITKSEAKTRKESIESLTGHQGIFIAKTGAWEELSSKYGQDRTESGFEDPTPYRVQIDAAEPDPQIEKDLITEVTNRSNPETLDYTIHNFYLLEKEFTEMMTLTKKLEKARDAFNYRKNLLQQVIQRHPGYIDEWFPTAKERLTAQKETEILERLEKSVVQLTQIVKPKMESDPKTTKIISDLLEEN